MELGELLLITRIVLPRVFGLFAKVFAILSVLVIIPFPGFKMKTEDKLSFPSLFVRCILLLQVGQWLCTRFVLENIVFQKIFPSMHVKIACDRQSYMALKLTFMHSKLLVSPEGNFRVVVLLAALMYNAIRKMPCSTNSCFERAQFPLFNALL